MENTDVEAIGKFVCFLCCKGKVYRTAFHVTTTNNSPNLLSRENSILLQIDKTMLHHTVYDLLGSRTILVESQASRPRNLLLIRVQNSSSNTHSSTIKMETHTGLLSIDHNTVTQCPLTKANHYGYKQGCFHWYRNISR